MGTLQTSKQYTRLFLWVPPKQADFLNDVQGDSLSAWVPTLGQPEGEEKELR